MPQAEVKDKTGFLFFDFSTVGIKEMDYIRKMDGMAAGTFVSMYGDEITFTPEELPEYVKNTERVLRSTKDSQGNIVGLPIDKADHNWEGGAGWIIGLEIDTERSVIIFTVNWTEEGIELISKNLVRFFSPSVDIVNKVILGGSLTNYPASRDSKGQIKLRPIELSKYIKELDMTVETQEKVPNAIETALANFLKRFGGGGSETQSPEPKDKKEEPTELSTDPNRELARLVNDPKALEAINDLVDTRVKEMAKTESRKNEVQNFVSDLIGGNREKPYGLAMNSKELIAFLLSLNDLQYKYAKKLLTETREKAIDFAEHGIAEDGFVKRPQLPAVYKGILLSWLNADPKNTVEQFFAVNPEVGKIEDFDLAEFHKAKE